MPDVYTHGHHDSVLRSHRWRTAANSAAYLLPHLRSGDRLLDVGCGPGTLTVDLAARVAPGEVIGVDLADDVIVEAEAHARAQDADNVSFRAGDFRELDLAPGSFDVAHAHQVLQHLTDPVGALAAMGALVRPGGIVAVRDGDYSAFTWAPEDPGLSRWLELYMAVTRHNGAEANAARYLPAWARAAGFDEDLCLARRPRLVERPVGRALGGLGVRRAGGALRAGHAARPDGPRRGLAPLGRRPRRRAGDPARRADLPRHLTCS